MRSLTRLFAITAKEVRQLGRDRLTFGMIVGIPLLQIILFGYAINLDVRHLSAAVADQSGSRLSRELIADLQATQVVDVVALADTAEQLNDLLRRGDIHVGVFIPRDFERRIRDGRPAAQLLVSGTDPSIVNVALQIRQMPLNPRKVNSSSVKGLFEVRTFYNPERRSAVQIVPALMGVILHLTMVLFTAIAIVRERERGNLELLITTPVRTWELMTGKLLPYIFIGLIQVTIILLVGTLLFDVPIRGDLGQLYLAALVFIAAALSLGLLISTLADTQFQAIQLTIFTFLPSILLSGFMFPFEGMPRIAQNIAEVIPLTHFVRLVRGIVLRGASLVELMPAVYALLAFFIVMMLLTGLRFRKRLD